MVKAMNVVLVVLSMEVLISTGLFNLEYENFEVIAGNPHKRAIRQIDDEEESSGGMQNDMMQNDMMDIDFMPDIDKIIRDSIEKLEVNDASVEDQKDQLACEASLFGCCPNSKLPRHGPNGEGCCLEFEGGCCNDFLRTNGETSDCDCNFSMFGCCPDGVTPKWDAEGEGCGCKHTTYGCCQDQYTTAQGPDYQGCPCSTSEYGCCADGETEATGPNGEGCLGCEESAFGCCPDKFTPALGAEFLGCQCAASEYGCCPDGVNAATGINFEGCDEKPGEACQEPKDGGTGEEFSVQWFFDIKEGRCSRFWFGGEGGNRNRFPDQASCTNVCIDPPGSARCYLPKVEGVCTGNDERWFYDSKYKQCNSFRYGGCLGNSNRFVKRSTCEATCVKTSSLSICEQPLDAGPCRGEFQRWFYDEQTGECKNFSYSGCLGNKNRFFTKESCQNSCHHKKQILEATIICKQKLSAGTCNETNARWGFDVDSRQCKPFYYSGCEGNKNNFETRLECSNTCPNAFPPELEVVHKIMNVEEGTEVLLKINVSGNPYPDIFWQHNTENVILGDRVVMSNDNSILITRVMMGDAGSWMVTANNGLGKVVRKQISLTVYPSSLPIKVTIPNDQTIFEFGSEIILPCNVEGYPEPTIKWLKNNAGLPFSDRIVVDSLKTLKIKRASPIGKLNFES